ncbi:response regulator transcription factor [Kribbella sp. VKM Ac-2566]|uniref:response regulator transcription factor n=1 Tax=Kribbella sp. VKM Ac-2566 TaxID=2512218 RepID=UPI0010635911|nr:response regulator transcription factor [Kribbella sp. VKM Ac-2566]TDW98252.1 two-component system nitrate/nitrite response regulator NarP [Kribbella sp. VKM Ac-2566]
MADAPLDEAAPRHVRVAIVEDDTLMREFMTVMPEFETVGAYSTVEELLSARPDADVVVLDLWIRPQAGPIPPLRGARAVKAVGALGYRILLYTSEQRRPVLVGCLAAGADGVILKSESRQALTEAIIHVAAGGAVLTTALTGLAELFQRKGLLPVITKPKLDVLRAKARGETHKQVAARLYISDKTVEKYMAYIQDAFRDYLHQLRLDSLDEDVRPSPAMIEQHLGLAPGDLLDLGPTPGDDA